MDRNDDLIARRAPGSIPPSSAHGVRVGAARRPRGSWCRGGRASLVPGTHRARRDTDGVDGGVHLVLRQPLDLRIGDRDPQAAALLDGDRGIGRFQSTRPSTTRISIGAPATSWARSRMAFGSTMRPAASMVVFMAYILPSFMAAHVADPCQCITASRCGAQSSGATIRSHDPPGECVTRV